MLHLHHMWSWIVEWAPYAFPAVVNMLLILLGVVMSLPKLAEAIENTPRYRKVLAVVCVIAGCVGFYFDVKVRHDSDRTSTELLAEVGTALTKTNELLTNTNVLVTRTSSVANSVTGAVTQIATLHTEMDSIQRGINAAKEKHDPQMVHDLEAQAQTAQQKLDNASRELKALTMAPQVADQLREWQGEHAFKQQTLHNYEWEEQTRYPRLHQGESDSNIDAGIRALQKEWEVQYQKADAEDEEKLKWIISSADSVRKELLLQLPPQFAAQRIDKYEEQQFADGIKTPQTFDRNQAATYLENLAQRVPPPK